MLLPTTFGRPKHKTTFKPRRFDPNVTLTRAREPRTVPWEQICSERKTMRQHDAVRLRQVLLQALAGLGPKAPPRAARAFTRQLAQDLTDRGVLCDAARPCTVAMSPADGSSVTICLPPARTDQERAAVVCEPYGEAWQQLGGEVHLFNGSRTRFKMLSNMVWSTSPAAELFTLLDCPP